MDEVKVRDVTWAQVVKVCHVCVVQRTARSTYSSSSRESGNPGRQAPAFVTLDSAFAGMTPNRWIGRCTARHARDRLSRPAPTSHHNLPHAKPRPLVVSCRSSVVHQNHNPFRPLSEMRGKLSPRSSVDVDSLHRRTRREIMTSDWRSEAGWSGCRSGSGQAGKV